MARSVPFRLNRSGVLLALVSAAFAGQAVANTAGRVDFAIGGATLTGSDGQRRALARGTVVNSGDVVHTNDGRVQMRMQDGAYISLQPNTEFGIKSYNYEGKTDGTENAFYSLLKGAMRTVTGLIGRVNHNRYQVATPTATVGIRGTGGLIQVLNDGSTLVQGTSGIWFLANPAGSIDIPAGVSGIAPVDPKQPPKETVQIPTAGPSPLPPATVFTQGDQRTGTGENVLTAGTLLSGSGYAAVLSYGGTLRTGATVDGSFGNAIFNAGGQLEQFEPTQPFNQALLQQALVLVDAVALPTSTTYTLESGSLQADFGTDGILAWGRWIDRVSIFGSAVNYDANMGLHYVVGAPTVAMPQVGTATYTLLGATSPTYVDGSTAPGTLTSGSLSVDFGQLTVGVNLNVAMPNGFGYAVNGGAPITGSTFTGTQLSTAGSGGACGSGCTASVQGFFAGTTAERAGLGYQINEILVTGATKDVVGAAAFAKQ